MHVKRIKHIEFIKEENILVLEENHILQENISIFKKNCASKWGKGIYLILIIKYICHLEDTEAYSIQLNII